MQEGPQQFDAALKSAQENSFSLTREACQFAVAFFCANPKEIHINREFVSFDPNDPQWQKRANFNELKTVHDYFVEYCKKKNLNQADLARKISHSFYCFDRNPLDIVATKRKEDYVAKKQLDRDDKDLIPHGSFGKFREGVSLQTGALTGVKMTVVKSSDDYNKIVGEANITRKATGEDIKCVSRVRSDSQKPFLKQKDGQIKVATKMPLYPGIELHDWLNQNPNMWQTIEARIKISLALIEAVKSVQDNLIMHRDIKPENILVDVKGSHVNLKLIDFGLAQQLDYKKQCWESTKPIGTVLYTAPENLGCYGEPSKMCQTSFNTDPWSAGIVMARVLGKGFHTDNMIKKGLADVLKHQDVRDLIDGMPAPIFFEIDNALYQVLVDRDFKQMVWELEKKLDEIETIKKYTASSFHERYSQGSIPDFTFQYLLANNRDILSQNADCLSTDQALLLLKAINPQVSLDELIQVPTLNEHGVSPDAAIQLLSSKSADEDQINFMSVDMKSDDANQILGMLNSNFDFNYLDIQIKADIRLKLQDNDFNTLISMVKQGAFTKQHIDDLAFFDYQNVRGNIPFIEACYDKKIIDLSKFAQYVGKDYINQHHMLSKAVQSVDIEAVKILLGAGAENIHDRKGFKPVDYAVKTGNQDIIALMEQKFGKIAAPAEEPRRTLVVDKPSTEKLAVGKSLKRKNSIQEDNASAAKKTKLGANKDR